jgi:hypothetical protein
MENNTKINYELSSEKLDLDTNGLKTKIDDQNNIFNKKLEEFLRLKKPNVMILTPCYGGICHVNYLISLMNTMNFLRQLNIPVQITFCKSDSLISRARNNLIAKAMSNKDITHIMFIDNDISWEPIDIVKLLLTDKSLIGGVYPLKRYVWEKLVSEENVVKKWIDRKNNSQLKNIVSDTDIIQHNLLKYNVNYLENVLTINENLAKVRHIATGFMMFKRSTIEQMYLAYPNTKYTDDVGFLQGDENNYAYALFDCGIEEGHYFSEDWLFCHRWSKMGGSIYLEVSINLKHSGVEDYNGSYISSII